jgi:hypothetical protein
MIHFSLQDFENQSFENEKFTLIKAKPFFQFDHWSFDGDLNTKRF